MKILNLKIIEQIHHYFTILISDVHQQTKISFSPVTKLLIYLNENTMTDLLKENEYQLRKLLHNKRTESYFVGFEVNFSFNNNLNAIDFNDKTKLVVLDRTGSLTKIYTTEKGIEPIDKIFTDGSFLENKKRGAFVALLQNTDKKFNLIYGKSDFKSSSLLELQAAIAGLKKLSEISKIRIITDSRYVIKGPTEWVNHWRLNNWYTIQGTKVKNIDYWVEFEKLIDGKYIEFQWIKSHSLHFENTLCDKYAKEAALK
jgi:ribonuclease HI